jgi:DNA uptake protein ComE-like DNA-binding protein
MTIDLNQATQDELDAIKGLEGHGFEIVRCREDRGRFTTLRELNEVPGLANKVPDDLAEHLHIA